MNIRELIEELEEIAREHGDDVDVRVADQPSWPFEYELSQIATVNIAEETCEVCDGSGIDDGETCDNCDGTGKYREEKKDGDEFVVYLATGNQIGYLPTPAANELGWGR